MDPMTISLLGGAGLGALGWLNNRGDESSNLAERQAAARAQGVGLNYAMPEATQRPDLLQSLITGTAAGANIGQQLGMAKNLINKQWEGDPNAYNGQAFQAQGWYGPEVSGYTDAYNADVDAYNQIGDYNQEAAGFSRARAPSVWDTFQEKEKAAGRSQYEYMGG